MKNSISNPHPITIVIITSLLFFTFQLGKMSSSKKEECAKHYSIQKDQIKLENNLKTQKDEVKSKR